MSASRIFVEGLIFLLQIVLTALDWLFLFLATVGATIFKGSSSSSPRHASRKTVVIVGGNFSGLVALWELVKPSDVSEKKQLWLRRDPKGTPPAAWKVLTLDQLKKVVSSMLCAYVAAVTVQLIASQLKAVSNSPEVIAN